MARIRTIKPEFWTSEQVVTCSPLARLLFVGLWTFADDHGIHPAAVRRLKMEVFPADTFDDATIAGLVAELVSAGLVQEYGANGERFWIVTGWHRHQRIDKPTFRHPPPPDTAANPLPIRRTLGEDSSNVRRGVVDASPPDWNGLESNGTGVEPERNKRKPPPPTTNGNDASPSEDWAAVEVELSELGLEAAGGTVELARKRDYTPARLREAIRVWQDHPDWGPGTIHEHVKQTRGNIAAEKGWWPKSEAKSKPSHGDARLNTAYGPRLDKLSGPELRDLMEAAGITANTMGHCRTTPSLRDKLLAQLARNDSAKHEVAK